MTYFIFIAANWRLLAFGMFLALISGFGQTFFIGLFSDDIRTAFAISHGEFGNIYSVATFLSAVFILYFGSRIDEIPLVPYIVAISLVMVAGCLLWVFSNRLYIFVIGLFLVRFVGQGLFSHASKICMARYFDTHRGKAMSIAMLGYPLSEGIFPIAFVAANHAVGWRSTWMIIALVVALGVIPTSLWLLRGHGERHANHLKAQADAEQSLSENSARTHPPRSWTRNQVLKDWRFYAVLPAAVASPLLLTAIFFFQAFVAQEKGWSLTMFAGGLAFFALAKLTCSLGAGTLIDSFSARSTLPYFMIPFIVANVILYIGTSAAAFYAFMFLAGAGEGAKQTALNSLWPEVYGARHIGAIKAFTSSAGVCSTALAPAGVGAMIDAGLGIDFILTCFLAFLAVATTLLCIAVAAYRTPE